jgi:uncharacterized protein (UPF0333 family)
MVKFQKRGSIELSFQLIFSLILVAVFIYASFVGIKYFLDISEHAQINTFIAELQSKVEAAGTATEISQTYEISLPSGIKYVCFSQLNNLTKSALTNSNITACKDFERYLINYKDMNMFFCPAEAAWKVSAPMYMNINCNGKNCLTFPKNPYCIPNANGKVRFKLEMNLGDEKIRLS